MSPSSAGGMGVSLLVDVYHALNVVPFSLLKEGLLGRVRGRWRLQVLPAG